MNPRPTGVSGFPIRARFEWAPAHRSNQAELRAPAHCSKSPYKSFPNTHILIRDYILNHVPTSIMARTALRGLSEIVATVLLLLISVAFGTVLVLMFLNNMETARSQLALEGADKPCLARIVVAVNEGGNAALYVYNYGESECRFVSVYSLRADGSLGTAGNIVDGTVSVPPGRGALVRTDLPYGAPGYRLATDNGETVDYYGG